MHNSLISTGSVAGGPADGGRGKLALLSHPGAGPSLLRFGCRHAHDQVAGEQRLIEHIIRVCDAAGYGFPRSLIVNYYVSLKTNPFVVLAGPPGTGKAPFTRLFAEALVGEERSQYALIPGGASWHRSTGEGSYYRSIQDRFTSLRFQELLQEATSPSNTGKLYLVCFERLLPEEVEYYLTRLLQVGPNGQRHLRLPDLSAERQVSIPANVAITATVDTSDDTSLLGSVALRHAGLIAFRALHSPNGAEQEHLPPPPVGFQRLWLRAAVQDLDRARRKLSRILGPEQYARLGCSPELRDLLWSNGRPLFGHNLQELTSYIANSFDEQGYGLFDPLNAVHNAQIAYDAQVIQRVIWRLGSPSDSDLQHDLSEYLEQAGPPTQCQAVA